MPTTEIYDLDWTNAHELHEGEWPDRGDDLDPVPSIRVAHDSVVYAIRQLDRLEVSQAMEDVLDAIKRLNDAIPSLGGRGQGKAAKGRATLQDVRKRLRNNDLEYAGHALHEARHLLTEALDTQEGAAAGVSTEAPETPATDAKDTPDPTVELSDALEHPKEDLTLLETAVLEAHHRDRRYSEHLRYRIQDVRREIEEAQSEASSRLQERRGKLGGGSGG